MMRRHRLSTAVRLAGVLGLVLAAVLTLAVVALVRTFQAQASAATMRTLVAQLDGFSRAAEHRPAGQDVRTFTRGYLHTQALPDGELLVVAFRDGHVLGSSGSDALLRTTLVRSWTGTPPAAGVRQRITIGQVPTQLVAAPLVVGARTVGTVVVTEDLTREQADAARVRTLTIGEALLALLAGVAAGYLLLRRLLRRLGRVTVTAAGLGSGELERRLGEHGGDEVGQLAATFDAMADRLGAAMTAQRRLLSDVSHQLRTPLTVARGHLEVLDRTGSTDPAAVHETVALVVDEIDHMRALVERLLMLGRALEPDFLEPHPVDLRTFCLDLTESARVLADRDWRCSDVPDVVVEVDEAKLRGALLNLIDNAVRATSVGDVVGLSVETGPDGSVTLAVEDSGPGIPAERRAAVLQRFARPGAADSEGSGLGLAIARTVAQAHGGDLSIGESGFGGCRVALTLPASVTATLAEDSIAQDSAADPPGGHRSAPDGVDRGTGAPAGGPGDPPIPPTATVGPARERTP